MSILQGKHITLICTGSVAIYKACEVVSRLKQEGAIVHVVLTKAAREFVAPLTFEALSGNPVGTEQFKGLSHLELSQGKTALVLIVPATANIIAKIAHGIADDLASATALAHTAPLAVAPAMNTAMWEAKPTQRNVAQLLADGIHILGPASGHLACGATGSGRMIEPEEIIEHVKWILSPKTLEGKRILVTAGPTWEALDPVRVLANRSSGRQGYAIAHESWLSGADVTLVTGPTAQPAPYGVKTISVESCESMRQAVFENIQAMDAFISVAAVCDFRAKCVSQEKIKKSDGIPVFELTANPDIVSEVASSYPDIYTVGFAAETCDILAYARKKRVDKHLTMIVANDASEALGSTTNAVTIITEQQETTLARTDKASIARSIVESISKELR